MFFLPFLGKLYETSHKLSAIGSLAGNSKSTAPFKANVRLQSARKKRTKVRGLEKRGGVHQRERKSERPTESERVSERWSLTHLVGQGHKRRCLPGLQWSMKPPGECNRRALEPPYGLLTNQPANSLKGSGADKGHRLLRPAPLPGARTPTKEPSETLPLSLQFDSAFDLRQ